jgi:hypothetical protein
MNVVKNISIETYIITLNPLKTLLIPRSKERDTKEPVHSSRGIRRQVKSFFIGNIFILGHR